jgi:hypothetical protein
VNLIVFTQQISGKKIQWNDFGTEYSVQKVLIKNPEATLLKQAFRRGHFTALESV